MAKDVYFE